MEKKFRRGKTNLIRERLALWTALIEFFTAVLELLIRFVNYDTAGQLRV
jgi:hypothetical protein